MKGHTSIIIVAEKFQKVTKEEQEGFRQKSTL